MMDKEFTVVTHDFESYSIVTAIFEGNQKELTGMHLVLVIRAESVHEAYTKATEYLAGRKKQNG